MEKVSKLQQTTSTQAFYDPVNRPGLTNNQKFPLWQPMKSSFPQLIQSIDDMNDRTQILMMEQEINVIRKKMRKCGQNIWKISQLQELKLSIQKMIQQLAYVRSKYLQQNSILKEQIQSMLNSLQKQVANYKKEWEKLRMKCSSQLSQEIQEIKTQKQSNQVYLSQLLKSTNMNLKQNINEFTNQLKVMKKNRNLRTQKLFSHLQSVQYNLNMIINQQESKRNEYDSIIYGLLDKTCENAANALRRRVY